MNIAENTDFSVFDAGGGAAEELMPCGENPGAGAGPRCARGSWLASGVAYVAAGTVAETAVAAAVVAEVAGTVIVAAVAAAGVVAVATGVTGSAACGITGTEDNNTGRLCGGGGCGHGDHRHRGSSNGGDRW